MSFGTPASVPDAVSIPARTNAKKQKAPKGAYYFYGGAGGNRTRVRESSTGGSTYLVRLLFS
jgi:hypothetical protein